MIHISVIPGHPPLQTPDSPSREEWESIARAFYSFAYTYYDRDPEEVAWIKAQNEWIKTSIPLALREGVHLLEAGGGFMGEDVYIADGELTHTIHVRCHKCHESTLIWRGKGSHENCHLWCVTCASPSEGAPFQPWETEEYGDTP